MCSTACAHFIFILRSRHAIVCSVHAWHYPLCHARDTQLMPWSDSTSVVCAQSCLPCWAMHSSVLHVCCMASCNLFEPDNAMLLCTWACTCRTWIVAVGIGSAIMLGFVMGANDIANAFGTSVGAGVLTVRQACLIAAIFDVVRQGAHRFAAHGCMHTCTAAPVSHPCRTTCLHTRTHVHMRTCTPVPTHARRLMLSMSPRIRRVGDVHEPPCHSLFTRLL
jgi:hypothetical protein